MMSEGTGGIRGCNPLQKRRDFNSEGDGTYFDGGGTLTLTEAGHKKTQETFGSHLTFSYLCQRKQ